MNVAQLISAASAAHGAGNLKEAGTLCRQVLSEDPTNAQAMLLLGVIETKIGDPFRAANLLQQVRVIDPTSFQAPFWEAIALRKLGRVTDAIHAAEKAIELNPSDPQAMTQLGLYYMDVRMLREAEACLTRAIDLAPKVTQVQFSLAHCLHLQGRLDEAVAILRFALATSPQTVDSVLRRAKAFLAQNSAPLAAECARIALELDHRSREAQLILARILVDDNRPEEAQQFLSTVISRSSPDPAALVTLGIAAQGLGRLEDARDCFLQSISASPDQGYAYMMLAFGQKAKPEDRGLVEKMSDLIAKGSLPPDQESFLWYGIGKVQEDLGDYEAAMEAYDSANQAEYDLRIGGRGFDRLRYAEQFDRTIGQFTQEFIKENKGHGSPSELPILIVGMMRSGTTLMEQILSSHPSVGGTGEQPFWLDNWRSGMTPDQKAVDPKGIVEAADRYLAILERAVLQKARAVDKMPANYPGLGIIHLALPNAKIIHMRRDPIDTCLSIYTTPNRSHPEFAYDRDNIICAYREYQRIMKHWMAVLPEGVVLEVDYEELVSDPEPAIRRVLEFCSLPWDEACLRPELNRKSVSTPSAWQVRQPIYRTSSGRRTRFEPWLGAFQELATGIETC